MLIQKRRGYKAQLIFLSSRDHKGYPSYFWVPPHPGVVFLCFELRECTGDSPGDPLSEHVELAEKRGDFSIGSTDSRYKPPFFRNQAHFCASGVLCSKPFPLVVILELFTGKLTDFWAIFDWFFWPNSKKGENLGPGAFCSTNCLQRGL